LRCAKEERTERDGGRWRDLNFDQLVCFGPPGCERVNRPRDVHQYPRCSRSWGLQSPRACHKVVFLGKESPCRSPNAICCRWFRRSYWSRGCILVLTWTTGAALLTYINSNCSWRYPASAEGFPEQVSGFAVTSASSKNKIESFHPFGESRFCHSAEQARRALFTIWARPLSIQSVKIGMVSGDVELRGTSSSGVK